MGRRNNSVWIVNEHLTTPEIGGKGHSRHYILAKEFAKNGYHVTLISSSFSKTPFVNHKISGLFKVLNNNIDTVLIRAFKYKKSNSPIRILNWIIYAILLPFTLGLAVKKPDLVIVSSTPMLPNLSVRIIKLFIPKLKVIMEIRDLWPLTPLSIGNYKESSLFIRGLKKVESFSYRKADYIVSVLENANLRVAEVLGNDKFHYKWISNGIEVNKDEVSECNKEWLFRRQLDPNSLVIGYAGTLGKANAMEYIIDTFNEYFEGSNIYLVLLGDGGEKDSLVKRSNGNDNILFEGSVNSSCVHEFYGYCDFLYLSWRATDLYKYGISANKIFEYMHSGKPIIMSSNIDNDIVSRSGCGIIAKAEDPYDLHEKIKYCQSLSLHDRRIMGSMGKEYVLENFSYNKLALDYLNVLEFCQSA